MLLPHLRQSRPAGGVCLTHGARWKGCSRPGCNKAVKLAGNCLTHGPSRRKCNEVGCDWVAVQGGRCLIHGARRKVCNYLSQDGAKCGKNAIIGGMCKKHNDSMADVHTPFPTRMPPPPLPSFRKNHLCQNSFIFFQKCSLSLTIWP